MATITLKGNPIHTVGDLPQKGAKAPDFQLTAPDLSTKSLKDYQGNRVVLNIFPSVDTDVCAASVRKFNEQAGSLPNTKVVCVSRDLPFAQQRFCGAEGIDNVEMLSDFRSDFAKTYGVGIEDGPLAALHSRAIVVLDENGNVLHSEQVPEIVQEPDYDAAMACLK